MHSRRDHSIITSYISTRIMYYEHDLDYTHNNYYYHNDLVEMYDVYMQSYMPLDQYTIDEDYARDTQDYDALAYRHYA